MTAPIASNRIAEAMLKHHGIVTDVADLLRCDIATIHRLMRQEPDLREVKDEERERLLDKCERKISEAVDRGDLRAVCYVLSRLGADRGWSLDTRVTASVTQTSSMVIIKGKDAMQADVDEAIVRSAASTVVVLPDNGRGPIRNKV